jgi:hypothetical protein
MYDTVTDIANNCGKKKKKNVPLKLVDMVDVPDILFILYFYIVFSSCCEAPDLKYTYLLREAIKKKKCQSWDIVPTSADPLHLPNLGPGWDKRFHFMGTKRAYQIFRLR